MNRAFVRYSIVALVVFGLLFFLLRTRLHLSPLFAYLFSVNGVGFAMYALDKLLARRSWLRVPETLLHIIEFLGATPAALAAQQLFWHKAAKRRYQVVFWSIALLQVGIVYTIFYTDLLQNIW